MSGTHLFALSLRNIEDFFVVSALVVLSIRVLLRLWKR